MEEVKSDENDKEAIGTLSKADEEDIYSIIENSTSLTYSLQVQPTRLLKLNNDHSAVEDTHKTCSLITTIPTRREFIIYKVLLKNWTQKKHRTQSAVFQKTS